VESVGSRNTFARLRIAADAGELVDPIGATSFGETEDHAVQVKLPALAIAKTSNATSHSGVIVPGQKVVYTVTATNPGPSAFTAGFPASLVDNLAGVLDDATFNNDAVIGGNGTGSATWSSGTQRLSWSGALGVGQSVSLTYSVTLKSGGDATVRNVVFQPVTDGQAAAVPACSSTVVDSLYSGGTVVVDSATRYPCAAHQYGGFTTYRVSFFYSRNDGTGSYPSTPDSQVTRSATLADQTAGSVSVVAGDKVPDAAHTPVWSYTGDSYAGNVLSATLAGDGSTELRVFFTSQFTVTYAPGAQGAFSPVVYSGLNNGATTPAAPSTPGNAGYTFAGWSPARAATVTANVTYTAQWSANANTAYRVEFYYQSRAGGAWPATATSSVNRTGTTGASVSVAAADKTPDSTHTTGWVYTGDAYGSNVLSSTLAGNGSTVLKVYFKAQYTVTYAPGVQGTFASVATSNLDYNATTPAAPSSTPGNAGWTFTGWSPARAASVTADQTYTALWSANANTGYKVEFYYQDRTGGTWPATATSSVNRTGTTAASVSVSTADRSPDAGHSPGWVYAGDAYAGNVLSDSALNGDGSTVLKVYFKAQYTVTYAPGAQGTFASVATSGLDYGAATPAAPALTPGNAGWTFTGWSPSRAASVTGDQTYTALWGANANTGYKVEFYYQNRASGTWPAAATSSVNRTGTTAAAVSVSASDRSPDSGHSPGWAYTGDGYAGNVLSGTVAGNGSTVLKVYFKAQYTVVYAPGTQGTFASVVSSGLDYGASTPAAPSSTPGNAGYTFTGWSPSRAASVAGDQTYTALWSANTNTGYRVEFFYQDRASGSWPAAAASSVARSGTTGAAVSVSAADKVPDSAHSPGWAYAGDAYAGSVVSDSALNGDGSTVLRLYFKAQYTVVYAPGSQGVFSAVAHPDLDYGASTPAAPSSTPGNPGYTFNGWSPARAAAVTADATYVAQWGANTDTAYKVEFYYQDRASGAWPAAASSSAGRTGTTDQPVSVSASDRTPDSGHTPGWVYTGDGSVSPGNALSDSALNGDGSTVLRLYFKAQYTVVYAPGSQGAFSAVAHPNLDYNASTPAAPGTPGNAGYTFNGWSPSRAASVTADATYVAQWTANTNTAYKVEFYYQDRASGAWPTAATSSVNRTGTTGQPVSVSASDKVPDSGHSPGWAYAGDAYAGSVVSDSALNGDGSTVLKLYFKAQYTVTYEPGTQGTFADVVYPGLDYGASTPAVPAVPGNPGWTFSGWSPVRAAAVTADAAYTALWAANTYTGYTVEFYYQDRASGLWPAAATLSVGRTGTTGVSVSAGAADRVPNAAHSPGWAYTGDAYAGNVLSSLVAGDGSTVLRVFFKAQYTVTYAPGVQGAFTAAVYSGLDYGAATPPAPGTPGRPGWHFDRWNQAVAAVVSADAVYTALWDPDTDTGYTVEFYYQDRGDGSWPAAATSSAGRSGTTGTPVSATAADRLPDTGHTPGWAYTGDGYAGNVVSDPTLDGGGSTVLRLYFKAQYTVAYDPGAHGAFAAAAHPGLDYGASTPAAPASTPGYPGYSLTGWSPAVAATVSADRTYTAQWNPDTTTPYTVEFYYQNRADGTWPASATSADARSGTTDDPVSATAGDRLPDPAHAQGWAYTGDGYAPNILSDPDLNGDGTTVLRLYFKAQYTVSYAPGAHGAFTAAVSSGLDWGAATPAAPATPGAPGWHFGRWDPAPAASVSADAVYTALWDPDTDTGYTVEFYYQNRSDGSWPAAATSSAAGRTGTTGAPVSATPADRIPDPGHSLGWAYTGDGSVFPANVLSDAALDGGGSTVLKLYFKAQYTITYDPGSHGAFAADAHPGLDWGTATPPAPSTPAAPGWHFDGWDQPIAATVSADTTYTALWDPDTDTGYRVEFYYQDRTDGSWPAAAASSASRTGTTGQPVSATPADKIPDPGHSLGWAYTGDGSASPPNILSDPALDGDGSTVLKLYFKAQYTVTYAPGAHGGFPADAHPGLDWGASTPAAPGAPGDPPAAPGWHFTGWDQPIAATVSADTAYTALWDPDTDTGYRVEFYYQDRSDGTWSTAAASSAARTGTTDTPVSATAADRIPDPGHTPGWAYTGDGSVSPPNVLSDAALDGGGSTVLKLYFKAQYTVTFAPGSHGGFPAAAHPGLDWGTAAPPAPATPGDPGWHFDRWDTTPAATVTSDTTYTALWAPDTDTGYTVEFYYQNRSDGTWPAAAASTDARTGTTGQPVGVPAADRSPDSSHSLGWAYTGDSSASPANVLSDPALDGGGSTVLKLYFKAQYTITYDPGSHGGFPAAAHPGLDWGTSTPAAPGSPGDPPAAPGWHFDGWDTAPAATVTADTTYTALWAPDTDTGYTVEFYYQDRSDGTWPATAASSETRTGTTDTPVSVAVADRSPDSSHSLGWAYTGDGSASPANVLSDPTLDGGGSTVLRLYFKAQYTVTYAPGSHGGFPADAHSGLDWGASTPQAPGTPGDPPGAPGWHFDRWDQPIAASVAADTTYTALWAPDTDTGYTVEFYYQDRTDGTWPAAATSSATDRTGTTGTQVSVTPADKTPDAGHSLGWAYTGDNSASPINTLSDPALDGDGSTVLKLYFKAQYTVVYDPGTHGGFPAAAHPSLDYGAVTPPAPGTPGTPGWHFDRWDQPIAATVAADTTYTALWAPDTDTGYTVEFYYQNRADGTWPTAATSTAARTGTTDTLVEATAADKTPDTGHSLGWAYTGDNSASPPNTISDPDLDGDGSTVLKLHFKAQYTITYAPGTHGAYAAAAHPGLDWGTPTPTAPDTPGTPGWHFDRWDQPIAAAVAADTTYTALWAPDTDTGYTVEFYYQNRTDGTWPATPTSTSARTGTTDTPVSATLADRIPDSGLADSWAYTGDSSAFPLNILSDPDLDGDGSTVLKLHFKAQYTVVYAPGTHGGFPADTHPGLDWGTTTPAAPGAPGDPAGAPGYRFDGWNPGRQATVTRSAAYTAQWNPVRYAISYDGLDGAAAPSPQPDSYTVEAGFPIPVGDPSKTYWTFAGWNVDYTNPLLTDPPGLEQAWSVPQTDPDTGLTVTGDIALTANWTRNQWTLSYDLNTPGDPTAAYGPGADGTDTVDAGTAISAAPDYNIAPSRTGWTFTGWTLDPDGQTPADTAQMPDTDQRIYATWNPNTDTAYTIEYYYQNRSDGTWPTTPTSADTRKGTTGQPVEATNTDRTPDAAHTTGWAYTGDNSASPPNTLSDPTLNSDGTTTLQLYFKAQYTVTFAPGSHGAFPADTHPNLDYGTTTPPAPNTPGKPGWNFAGWNPLVSDTVTATTTYTAQWDNNLATTGTNTDTLTNTGLLAILGGSLALTASHLTAARRRRKES
jgi:uncharacterized repeat protein (TIGR02543 family)